MPKDTHGHGPELAQGDWSDPFLLEAQLDEDERMLRDAAQAFAQDKLALLAVQPQQDTGGEEQAEEDRQADHQEEQEDRKEQAQHYSALPSTGLRTMGSRSAAPKSPIRARSISSGLTRISIAKPTTSDSIIQLRGMRYQLSKPHEVGR